MHTETLKGFFSLAEVKEHVRHNFNKVSQNLTPKLAVPAEEVDPGNLT